MREHMLDKCPVSSYAEVRQIIQEDLGAPPEQLFKQFSETPIASASLAQVGSNCLQPDMSATAVVMSASDFRLCRHQGFHRFRYTIGIPALTGSKPAVFWRPV